MEDKRFDNPMFALAYGFALGRTSDSALVLGRHQVARDFANQAMWEFGPTFDLPHEWDMSTGDLTNLWDAYIYGCHEYARAASGTTHLRDERING